MVRITKKQASTYTASDSELFEKQQKAEDLSESLLTKEDTFGSSFNYIKKNTLVGNVEHFSPESPPRVSRK